MSDANPDIYENPIDEPQTPVQDVDVEPDTTPEDDKAAGKNKKKK